MAKVAIVRVGRMAVPLELINRQQKTKIINLSKK